MSSMTLKEFMTRGNGGMEKRARVYMTPGYTPGGSSKFMSFGDGETEGEDLAAFGAPISSYARLQWINNQKNKDPEKYKSEIEGFYNSEPAFFRFIEGVNRQFVPGLLADDPDTLKEFEQLSADPNFAMYAKNLQKSVEEFKKNSWYAGLFRGNPKLAEMFAVRFANQKTMENLGLDPKKVDAVMPGLKAYDMNQHIPGMALAFGLPFGIGALTGHPGWGALLGLLGAGGYGYAKYNHIFDKPADVKPEETPVPEAPATTQELSEGADAPANEETAEDIPAPVEAPATEASPAPAAEAAPAPAPEAAPAPAPEAAPAEPAQAQSDQSPKSLSATPPSSSNAPIVPERKKAPARRFVEVRPRRTSGPKNVRRTTKTLVIPSKSVEQAKPVKQTNQSQGIIPSWQFAVPPFSFS